LGFIEAMGYGGVYRTITPEQQCRCRAAAMTDHPARPIFVIGSLVAACCAHVPRCPEPGESLCATDFILEPGGKGFNVALAAHRLGVPVQGVFTIGDDAAGALMRASFARLGLSQTMIETVDAATGAGVGLIQADGENRIAVFPGANAVMTAAHVAARAGEITGASLVFAQYEASDAPISEAFALARAQGAATMLNPSPYRPISPEILAATDIVVVNETEACALARDYGATGGFDQLARILAIKGANMLVVTRGGYGAQAWLDGVSRLEHPGFPVNVVDSIGAGDAFSGGFIAAWARGLDLLTALAWGCAGGAVTVSRSGLVDVLPDRIRLDAMIETGK
jgi:ribokinase